MFYSLSDGELPLIGNGELTQSPGLLNNLALMQPVDPGCPWLTGTAAGEASEAGEAGTAAAVAGGGSCAAPATAGQAAAAAAVAGGATRWSTGAAAGGIGGGASDSVVGRVGVPVNAATARAVGLPGQQVLPVSGPWDIAETSAGAAAEAAAAVPCPMTPGPALQSGWAGQAAGGLGFRYCTPQQNLSAPFASNTQLLLGSQQGRCYYQQQPYASVQQQIAGYVTNGMATTMPPPPPTAAAAATTKGSAAPQRRLFPSARGKACAGAIYLDLWSSLSQGNQQVLAMHMCWLDGGPKPRVPIDVARGAVRTARILSHFAGIDSNGSDGGGGGGGGGGPEDRGDGPGSGLGGGGGGGEGEFGGGAGGGSAATGGGWPGGSSGGGSGGKA